MTSNTPPTIDYYVWLMSDWAYLGGVRFIQLAARHGLAVNHVPMRMQDVYAASGGILLRDRSNQRRAYRVQELKRWSARLGIPVNIEPRFFPVDIDQASRMVIVAQQRGLAVGDFVNAIMRAIWAEDRDVADPDVLRDVADRLGLPSTELLAAGDTDNAHQEYLGNTSRALAAGVFGSPFYVFEGEVFWGQDRLDMLEDAIVRTRVDRLGRR